MFAVVCPVSAPEIQSGAPVAPARLRTAAAVAVLVIAGLNWIGWATDNGALTRLNPRWLPMMPWTALWLAMLSAAILLQAGQPSRRRLWLPRALTILVGGSAAIILTQTLTGRSIGVDLLWFGTAVQEFRQTWPGRPSIQVVGSVLLLSIALGSTWLRSDVMRRVWAVSLAAAMVAPSVAVLAYVFDFVALVAVTKSTGMAFLTAVSLSLLGVATLLVRPARGSVARLLAPSNRGSLLRLGAVITGFPLLLGISRRVFLALGSDPDEALTFAAAGGAVTVGLVTFYLTQREWEHRAVAESERAMLRATADSMIDPQMLVEAVRDPSGRVIDLRYLSANTAACTYLGHEESDLVGRTQLELAPSVAGTELQSWYFQCFDDGVPVVVDDFAWRSDMIGENRRYDIRATRAGPDRLSLTWRDVTERSEAAHRLATSEQNFRLLAENSADVVMLTRNGRFAWVSPSAEGVLGAPPEYWLGREPDEIIPPEEMAAHSARVKILAEGGVVKGRAKVVARDGTVHWVHLHAKPFYDADGTRNGTRSAFRVIDAEVAAEQVANEANVQRARADARFRKAMDSSAIGMCLVSPDGAFVEVNNAVCELFGYDVEALKTKTWQELTAPEYLEADLKNVEDVKSGAIDSYRMVKQFVHAGGQRIWGDLSVACIRDSRGRVEQFISQIIDITAEMHANEYNAILTEHLQRQSGRLAAELGRAAEYMRSIMPRGLAGRVAVTSVYLPARELGGDCFNYTWIDDDHLLVYLIDVSGHGLEPALLAVSVHNMLRAVSITEEAVRAPETVLAGLNRLFQMDQQDDHYFTMWIGVYEASSRTLRYASAGAPPALAFNSIDGGVIAATELFTISAPIGMFEETSFTSGAYQVPPGCHILLYSDGANDLRLANGKQLAAGDFRHLAARLAVAEPAAFSLEDLVEALRKRTTSNTFEDDFSMIHLRFD